MKFTPFFLLALFVGACSSHNNFSKIQKSMKAAEVTSLLGQPDRKQPMAIVEWWIYNKPEAYIVVIEADTVANAGTQKDLMAGMNDAVKSIDSLKSAIDSAK